MVIVLRFDGTYHRHNSEGENERVGGFDSDHVVILQFI